MIQSKDRKDQVGEAFDQNKPKIELEKGCGNGWRSKVEYGRFSNKNRYEVQRKIRPLTLTPPTTRDYASPNLTSKHKLLPCLRLSLGQAPRIALDGSRMHLTLDSSFWRKLKLFLLLNSSFLIWLLQWEKASLYRGKWPRPRGNINDKNKDKVSGNW